jgi:ATP-dependent Clp protease protease subunit
MDLRHDPLRWPPHPERSPEWPPGLLGGGSSLPGWLEERLFDQRIVMVRGPLTQQAATGIAAALLTLDAAGPDPVQLHVASSGGELSAAHAVIDVIDAMAAPVHAVVTSEAGGAVLAVLAAAQQRAAYRHARFKLAEPRAAGVTGTADEVAAAAGQHLRELEEVVLRLVEVTGQTRSRIEDDLSSGRILSAAEARDYGLIDTIVGKDERGPS